MKRFFFIAAAIAALFIVALAGPAFAQIEFIDPPAESEASAETIDPSDDAWGTYRIAGVPKNRRRFSRRRKNFRRRRRFLLPGRLYERMGPD